MGTVYQGHGMVFVKNSASSVIESEFFRHPKNLEARGCLFLFFRQKEHSQTQNIYDDKFEKLAIIRVLLEKKMRNQTDLPPVVSLKMTLNFVTNDEIS